MKTGKIISIETVCLDTEIDLYDIEVDDTHCFFANGILVHNCKEDGLRVMLQYDGKTVTAFTRNGKTLTLHGVFDESAKLMMKPGEVWDGELLAYKNDKMLERKVGNGIGNKAVRGTISLEEAHMLRAVVWDIVDFGSTIPYSTRWDYLVARFKIAFSKQVDTKFLLVASEVINSEDEAAILFDKALKAGLEGCIIKNMNAVWEPKRTKNLGKMKAELSTSLHVVGYQTGTGKYDGLLGALVCETEDGKVRVNVGTGFSDELRKELTPENTLDKIVEVLYNARISKKNGGKDSLFLPRFIGFREDKNVADYEGDVK